MIDYYSTRIIVLLVARIFAPLGSRVPAIPGANRHPDVRRSEERAHQRRVDAILDDLLLGVLRLEDNSRYGAHKQ